MNKKSRKIFFATISGGIIGKPGILSRVAARKSAPFTRWRVGNVTGRLYLPVTPKKLLLPALQSVYGKAVLAGSFQK
jgi:hypothetical protein